MTPRCCFNVTTDHRLDGCTKSLIHRCGIRLASGRCPTLTQSQNKPWSAGSIPFHTFRSATLLQTLQLTQLLPELARLVYCNLVHCNPDNQRLRLKHSRHYHAQVESPRGLRSSRPDGWLRSWRSEEVHAQHPEGLCTHPGARIRLWQALFKDTFPGKAVARPDNSVSSSENGQLTIAAVESWEMAPACKKSYEEYKVSHHIFGFDNVLGWSQAAISERSALL